MEIHGACGFECHDRLHGQGFLKIDNFHLIYSEIFASKNFEF